MMESKRLEWLLECLIHVIGRVAIKTDEVRETVGRGTKQVHAYNLCDGSMSLTQIARKAKIDPASLSRSVDRWLK